MCMIWMHSLSNSVFWQEEEIFKNFHSVVDILSEFTLQKLSEKNLIELFFSTFFQKKRRYCPDCVRPPVMLIYLRIIKFKNFFLLE